MEATGVYWRPVWHILSDGDFEMVLANAAHIKNVPGRKTVCLRPGPPNILPRDVE
jgi:transposase